MYFNVIQELARFGERCDSPLVEQKKVVVIELDKNGTVLGTRTEKGVRTIRWQHRCGILPSPHPLCDSGHYVLGISDNPTKASFATRCRPASKDLHQQLATRFPSIPELESVVAFLGKKLPASLESMSSQNKFVFEVDGKLLAGDEVVEIGKHLLDKTRANDSSDGEWECAFTGEKGPIYRGTLPSFKGPWVKTQRKSFVVCNRPVIDHGYVHDKAITNPMSPSVARFLDRAPSALVERGQFVQLLHTVTLVWTQKEHPMETLLPRILRGHTHARELEAHLDDDTGIYLLVSGSARRVSVLHADLRPVSAVARSVLELYGPRRDSDWDMIWWIQLINKHSREQEPRLTISESSSWMRSILSEEPLPATLVRRLLSPPKQQPPTGDHVRIAALRNYSQVK
jgi:hypothetical protein